MGNAYLDITGVWLPVIMIWKLGFFTNLNSHPEVIGIRYNVLRVNSTLGFYCENYTSQFILCSM